MSSFVTKVIGDKKEWRGMEARADALPRDYRIVYAALKRYLWRFTFGDGSAAMAVLEDVLVQFEAGAAQGKHALDVTGEDVAAFCDERLRDLPSYADTWRTSLNLDVSKKLGRVRAHG
jgi:DNA-binding ferritin-like protein (Dps family)